jgi:hypothetical protein
MNKFERELKGYVDGTEKMSGYDGTSYDFEGEMSSFDIGSYVDGMGSYATGGGQPSMTQPPYMVQYNNTSGADATGYLFGYNNFLGVTNGGNPSSLVVTNLMSSNPSATYGAGVTAGTYQSFLNQTGTKPFQISWWRLQASGSSVSLQLTQVAQINYYDQGTGQLSTTPMPWTVFKNSFQQQSDIIDGRYPVLITANTFLSFVVKAGTTLTFTMQVDKVISDKAALRGAPAMGQFQTRNLSPNGSPVVIQTGESVKNIAKS